MVTGTTPSDQTQRQIDDRGRFAMFVKTGTQTMMGGETHVITEREE